MRPEIEKSRRSGEATRARVDRGQPLVQFVARPGITDLSWGHPDPTLLPVAELRKAAMETLDAYGSDAIAYGRAAGSAPLIEWICERLGEVDGRTPRSSEVVITAGNSHALDQVVTLLTEPGDVVLVESPTYHLAIRILRDHPVRLVAVPSDDGGLSVDAFEQLAVKMVRQRRRVRLLYTIPTFHNPTGRSLSQARRLALVDVADRHGITVVEDDAYRELSFDGKAPMSVWSSNMSDGSVVRLGTFSKSIAPGLRVGFLTADEDTVAKFVSSGLLDSGGGNSHFAGLMVLMYARSGAYAQTVRRLVKTYASRFDALLDPIRAADLDGVSWTAPNGGYFTWLTFASRISGRDLRRRTEELGASFALGPEFYLDGDGGHHSARLAFTRYDEPSLERAGAAIVQALKEAESRPRHNRP